MCHACKCVRGHLVLDCDQTNVLKIVLHFGGIWAALGASGITFLCAVFTWSMVQKVFGTAAVKHNGVCACLTCEVLIRKRNRVAAASE